MPSNQEPMRRDHAAPSGPGAEERLQAIVDTARDAIVSADRNGQIILFNRAAEQMFGSSTAEMLGQSLAILMPERFRGEHQRGMARFVSTGQAKVIGQVLELVGLRKNGQEFPIELSLATWRLGSEPFFTAVIRDVTQRKQADLALKREKDELEKTNQIMLEREERIIELKHEVNNLLKELGRPAQFGG